MPGRAEGGAVPPASRCRATCSRSSVQTPHTEKPRSFAPPSGLPGHLPHEGGDHLSPSRLASISTAQQVRQILQHRALALQGLHLGLRREWELFEGASGTADLPPRGGDARQGRGGRCPAGLSVSSDMLQRAACKGHIPRSRDPSRPPLACRPSPPRGGDHLLSSRLARSRNISTARQLRQVLQHRALALQDHHLGLQRECRIGQRRFGDSRSPPSWGRCPAGQRGARRIAAFRGVPVAGETTEVSG
jgi:hypothetical protein